MNRDVSPSDSLVRAIERERGIAVEPLPEATWIIETSNALARMGFEKAERERTASAAGELAAAEFDKRYRDESLNEAERALLMTRLCVEMTAVVREHSVVDALNRARATDHAQALDTLTEQMRPDNDQLPAGAWFDPSCWQFDVAFPASPDFILGLTVACLRRQNQAIDSRSATAARLVVRQRSAG